MSAEMERLRADVRAAYAERDEVWERKAAALRERDDARRDLERLRVELANRDLLLEKYRETVGVTVGQREEAKAERDALRARLTGVAIHADRLKTWINDEKASITIAGSILGDLFAALNTPAPTTRTETA